MPLPGISITRSNIGVSPTAPTAQTALVIGPCSAGSPNTVYSFANPATVQATLGYGPCPTLAEIMLADGAQEVFVIPSSATIAGAVSTVLSSSGAPAITISGTPNDAFDIQLQLLLAGPLGTSTFQFSLDGGETFSPSLATTASYVVPNTGLTLVMPAGTYVANSLYQATAYAPRMNSNDLLAAMAVFTGSTGGPALGPPYVVAVANHTTASLQGLALAQALDSGMLNYLKFEMPTVGVVPTGGVDGNTADTISTFLTFNSSAQNGIMCVAERARRIVPLGFMGYGNPKLPFAFAVADRVQGDIPPTNPARVASGGMTALSLPTYDEYVQGEVYLQSNLCAPRTVLNLGGVFANQGVLKSQPGSSFEFVQWVKVLNVAQLVIQHALKKYINSSVRTVGNGSIDKRDAARINNDINTQLAAELLVPANLDGFKGYCSAVQFAVDLASNVLLTNTLNSTCTVVPLANVSNVAVTLAFATSVNPS
jgi:hypothetical protein